jgi:hypothetical protein
MFLAKTGFMRWHAPLEVGKKAKCSTVIGHKKTREHESGHVVINQGCKEECPMSQPLPELPLNCKPLVGYATGVMLLDNMRR